MIQTVENTSSTRTHIFIAELFMRGRTSISRCPSADGWASESRSRHTEREAVYGVDEGKELSREASHASRAGMVIYLKDRGGGIQPEAHPQVVTARAQDEAGFICGISLG